MNIQLKLLNLVYEFLLSTIKLYCLPSNLKHSLDSSYLPSLSKVNDLVPHNMDVLYLCPSYISFCNSIHQLNPASFQSYNSIIGFLLSLTSCPSMLAHMPLQLALRGLCSLEL